MDSATQFVLGAAVAQAAVGSRVGRIAPLVGGVVATLPDLDVFVPLGGAVEDFTYHRSATHSLFVLTLAAPPIAWLVHRLQRPPGASFGQWLLAVWLALVTHALLDALTIYGTQLLWPFSERPFGTGSVFIIDPVVTLSIAGGVLGAMLWRARRRRAARANALGLTLAGAYLAFGVAAQAHVHAVAVRSLERQGIPYERVLAQAAPFSSLAWRVLVIGDEHYHVAYHSLLAPMPELRLTRFARDPRLLEPVRERWEVRRLQWFSRGYYAASEVDGEVRLTDLRMGVEPDRYVFSFVVGVRHSPVDATVAVTRVPPQRFRDGDLRRILDVILGGDSLSG